MRNEFWSNFAVVYISYIPECSKIISQEFDFIFASHIFNNKPNVSIGLEYSKAIVNLSGNLINEGHRKK